jgi:hypothetical protein
MDLKILPLNHLLNARLDIQFVSIPVIYSTNCLICFNCAPPPVSTILLIFLRIFVSICFISVKPVQQFQPHEHELF